MQRRRWAFFQNMMLKKRSTDKTIKKGPNKKLLLRRVVEGLFLSNAGPKRGCWSYLTDYRRSVNESGPPRLIGGGGGTPQ